MHQWISFEGSEEALSVENMLTLVPDGSCQFGASKSCLKQHANGHAHRAVHIPLQNGARPAGSSGTRRAERDTDSVFLARVSKCGGSGTDF